MDKMKDKKNIRTEGTGALKTFWNNLVLLYRDIKYMRDGQIAYLTRFGGEPLYKGEEQPLGTPDSDMYDESICSEDVLTMRDITKIIKSTFRDTVDPSLIEGDMPKEDEMSPDYPIFKTLDTDYLQELGFVLENTFSGSHGFLAIPVQEMDESNFGTLQSLTNYISHRLPSRVRKQEIAYSSPQ